jgi:hypothetical protein
VSSAMEAEQARRLCEADLTNVCGRTSLSLEDNDNSEDKCTSFRYSSNLP